MPDLGWPVEQACPADAEPHWAQLRSNISLDFHGDPRRARLVVFSDGNHHMALEECLQRFLATRPQVDDVFYATTPPAVLLRWLEAGCLHLGNLRLSLKPHLFISPPKILDRVVASGRASGHVPFMRSRGNVLLVHQGNPKKIRGVTDLARADVRLFLSNPETETASYEVYADTLRGLARRAGVEGDFLSKVRAVYGERIHHREAPQALADERADAAMLYYHLALRYTRIFPGRFEIVPLDGAPETAAPENVLSRFHLALVDGGGEWGEAAREFLLGPEAAAIYARHGLENF
ncbi:MAG: ABC transporter substrate-binding protein [Gammaproteobacteria bacterium]|nr:MAG: ABC transporter substrate-binding protein [Gammaproteobacteria bacterium]